MADKAEDKRCDLGEYWQVRCEQEEDQVINSQSHVPFLDFVAKQVIPHLIASCDVEESSEKQWN
jgi:hypothetical protein